LSTKGTPNKDGGLATERISMADQDIQNDAERFDFEDNEGFLNALNNQQGISPDLAREMTQQLNQLRQNSENTLLVGTDGLQTITVVLAPFSIVKAEGPVLIPTSEQYRIVSMVSREFVQAKAQICELIADEDIAQRYWDDFLDGLFTATVELGNSDDRQLLQIPDYPQP
jgi:hypothetical protein